MESYRVRSTESDVDELSSNASSSSEFGTLKNSVPLLGGERIEGVYTEMTYLCPYSVPSAIKGTLYITNYKLYFKSSSKDKESSNPLILDVPLGFVSRVEKVGGQRTSGENAYGLEIFCKDIRSLRFALNKVGSDHRKDIFDSLRSSCFPLTYDSNGKLFAFHFTDSYFGLSDGWKVYDAATEYRRQGLPNEAWKISRINEYYAICDTYPTILGIPASSTEEDVIETSKFRSKARFPVLSWMHPESYASIIRCSQPLIGLSGNRSKGDEKYIQNILEANAQSHRLFIYDARPKVNAVANIVNGGGYENEDVYSNVELLFLDIHNIHVMREGLRRVRDMSFPLIDDSRWLSNVENTHWLDYLSSIICGAVKIAGKVYHGKTSVIVHCSDGWDRTAQLTSLSMLLLDSYYRSLSGFQALLEKEWMSFGHKFSHRIGHGEDKPNDNDRSPVFLQFIDCVWQISNQFPKAFEFNEYFLSFLLDHLYSCLFGTFLYNSDKERNSVQIQKKTKSLWTFVNGRRDLFLNPSYEYTTGVRPLFPEGSVRYMRLWTGYYCRWNPRMRPQETLRKQQSGNVSLKASLKSKVESLKRELESKKKNSREESPQNSSLHSIHITKYEAINI